MIFEEFFQVYLNSDVSALYTVSQKNVTLYIFVIT